MKTKKRIEATSLFLNVEPVSKNNQPQLLDIEYFGDNNEWDISTQKH